MNINKLPSRIPLSAEKVFSGVIYDIYQWQQKMFDGSMAMFECAKRENVVTVIPIVDGKILIQDEEQPNDMTRTGFPGGHIDEGEDPVTAAKRELHEETGMTFKNIKLVMVEDIGGPKLDWWAFRFVATEPIAQDDPHPGPGEKIVTRLARFEEVKQLAENNLFMSHRLMRKVSSLDNLLALPAVDASDLDSYIRFS